MTRRLLAVAVLCAAASCGPAARTYPPEYRATFTVSCERQTAPQVCACAWERIEADVPVSDFEALERMSAAQRTANPLTRQIQDYFLTCAGDFVREPVPAP